MKEENKIKIRGEGNKRPSPKKSKMLGVLSLTSITGITPKKAAELFVFLKISNLSELYDACKDGKVSKLDGWGEEFQAKIKQEIELQTLWIMSQCNKAKKDSKVDYNANKLEKEFLLNLAMSLKK
jgi:DNA polymerase/3'-5' exonuclease PolX